MIVQALLLSLPLITAGTHMGETLYTDLSGGCLRTEDAVLSEEPGSGRNLLSLGDDLLWKECPPGEPQRIVNLAGDVLYSGEYFSGPFQSAPGDGFMVSVPGELLFMDSRGNLLETLGTGEYSGSAAVFQGSVWFVSSGDGCLKRLDSSGTPERIELDFIPAAVQGGGDLLLVENAAGGFVLLNDHLEMIHESPGSFMPRLGNGTVTSCRIAESSGCEAVAWESVTLDTEKMQERSLSLELTTGNSSGGVLDDPTAHFDVPYMHQRWDTPDWFNGSWSCGPTSCMMAVQYYQRLTPDSIWCSYPEGHWSQWGNYIPVEYTFLGHTYDVLGLSPGSVWVPGAHGFICRDAGGAYWSYMVLWMEQHGLDSDYLGTTWTACTTELGGSWPVVASTTSPYTGGHILLFNGYYDNHSVICNDAYGDQNEPGWGSYYNGKDVVYDWPGYNNGNVQLGISQLFRARSEVLGEQGTLIDDRTHGYRKLGPCQYWHEQTTGHGGYSWWTYSTGAPPDTCVVEWIPELPTPGTYTVETFVPPSHATATGIYHIRTQSGWETAYLDQSSYSGQWAALGSWSFTPSTAMVRMGDYTGAQGQYISFDAIRFTLETGNGGSSSGVSPCTFGPGVNPSTPEASLVFHTPDGFSGNVRIYDTAGRLAAECSGTLSPGTLVPGIYFAVIEYSGTSLTARFTILP